MIRSIALSLFFLLVATCSAMDREDAVIFHERDSLLHDLARADLADTTRIETLLQLTNLYSNHISRDSSRILGEGLLQLSRTIGHERGEAWAMLDIGKALNNNPRVAAEYFRHAGQLFRKIGDKDGLANTFLQNGVIMYTQNNYEESRALFRRSLELFQALNDDRHVARLQHLYGLSLCKTGDYKNAMLNLQNALNSYIRMNGIKESYECRIGLADTYLASGLFADALIYYRMCNDYGATHDIGEMSIDALLGIGHVRLKLGDRPAAEKAYLEAYALSKNYDSGWRTLHVTDALYQFYEKAGRFPEAFAYLKQSRLLQDSLYNEKNMEAMASMKSEREIAEAENALLLSNLQNEADKRIKIILVGILAILLIAVYTSVRRYNLKKKMAQSLEEKNKALNMTMQSLKAAEAQLIKAEKMAVFGKLSAGIAHEIRNPLNFITNFSELSQQVADDFVHAEDKEEQHDMALQIKKLVDKIGYHGRRADSIVTRMLQHSRSAHTEAELTDVNRMAEEFSELAYESMRNLITNFECRLDKELDPHLGKIWVVPQDLSRVIINLLNNAFYAVHEKKHRHISGYEPRVVIGTTQHEDTVELIISDNGPGIPADAKEKIFEPFFTTKPIGEGTGLGLSICADIVKAAGGRIEVESQPETGTTFHVSFPVRDAVPVQAEPQDDLRQA